MSLLGPSWAVCAGLAAAAALAGFGGGWTAQGWRLETCQFQRDAYSQSLGAQNDAIAKLASAGEETARKLGEALAATKPLAAAAKARHEARSAVPAASSCDAEMARMDAER